VREVKLEVFFSASNDSNDVSLSKLLKQIEGEFANKIELITYKGQNELFNEYCLKATPAVVIEEMIKIAGFCPSKETLVHALRESGLE
jgi:hypothetical protein